MTDVQKNKGGKYMHYGKLTQGSLKVGDVVTAAMDPVRRAAIMRAHTATHLLDKALRTVLGTMSTRPAPWWSPTGCVLTSPTSPP